MTHKSINELYREGKMNDPPKSSTSQETNNPANYTNQLYELPRQRSYKGYWAGFWLGFFLQIIPGTLIAWAIQASIDNDRYVGRHVIGSIHGWLSLLGIAAFAWLVFVVFLMRVQ